jgi:hypothetical protein
MEAVASRDGFVITVAVAAVAAGTVVAVVTVVVGCIVDLR